MSECRFTVLLPTHNRADVLSFAIRSVLTQTLENLELFVVGDGCTDQTTEVIRGLNDPRIRWFDLPKAPGFGYANRNIALRETRGEYIAYMAHDDLWMPDHLAAFTSTFDDPHLDFAYTRPLWVIPRGLIAPGTFNLECASTLNDFLDKKHNLIPTSNVVHRRECLAKYGYWNEMLPQRGDLDLWSRIIRGGGGKNFAYLPEPTCIHFRAKWRNDAALVGNNEQVWELFHAVDGLLPQELKVPIPDAASEQQAVWEAMSADRAWAKRIRAAVRQALDQRIAQNDELISKLMHQDPTLDVSALADAFKNVALAWKPLPGLRKIIGANNRIRRMRNR